MASHNTGLLAMRASVDSLDLTRQLFSTNKATAHEQTLHRRAFSGPRDVDHNVATISRLERTSLPAVANTSTVGFPHTVRTLVFNLQTVLDAARQRHAQRRAASQVLLDAAAAVDKLETGEHDRMRQAITAETKAKAAVIRAKWEGAS